MTSLMFLKILKIWSAACVCVCSVQVRAENAVGAGSFGPSLQLRTRPLPPNPPRLECGSAGPQSLKLRWGDSNKSPNPDTDITYILQMEDRNQRYRQTHTDTHTQISFTSFSFRECLMLLRVIRGVFCARFVPIYRGPSHTFKVQRLTELSRYSFRIQAVSEAGEGPFSEIYSFTTTKSVPPTLKGTRERYWQQLHHSDVGLCSHYHVMISK